MTERDLARLAALATLVLIFQRPAMGDASLRTEKEPAALILGVAETNVLRGTRFHGGSIELRSRPLFHGLRAWTCLSATNPGGRYCGVGGVWIVPLGSLAEFGVSFGPGYFKGSRSFDLGYHLEFRSAAELNLRLGGGRKLGLSFGHVSNAHLGRENPGTEYMQLAFHLPLYGRL